MVTRFTIFAVSDMSRLWPTTGGWVRYQRMAWRRIGFLTFEGVEIHLGVDPDLGSGPGPHSAYLFVEDADALARAWLAAGAEVRARSTNGASMEGMSSIPTAT